ncbi:DNA repair protein RecO [Butyrivibrio sp. MC2013]|uniref:DNA repair protein RecO n=1 Tax=Butyrivibrio sp. MC2013 TaxID=1280686 RepID=UPI00047A9E6C|nr:DNA repair protein RecO [Butyrivibrio sp. MC2013]
MNNGSYDDARIRVSGIVIRHRPVGDYDFAVTILTMEKGKISAFARGARKPGGRLSGNVEPFCCGNFILFAGKNSYNIIEADIISYFEEFRRDLEKTVYGSFLLELADYYGTENSDERDLFRLLYVSLCALTREGFDRKLVRCVYEIKALMIDGQFPGIDPMTQSPILQKTLQHIMTAPFKELFSFRLSGQGMEELERYTRRLRDRFVDRRLSSLDMLSAFES